MTAATGDSFIRARRAILLLYALLSALVVAAAAWSIHSEREERLAEAFLQSKTLVRALDEHTGHIIDGTAQYLLDLRTVVEAEGGLAGIRPGRLEALLKGERLQGDAARRMFLLDARGERKATTANAGNRFNFTEREYFQDHVRSADRRPQVSFPFEARSDQGRVIPVSVRLDRRDGSFDGVAVVSLDAQYFVDFYRSLNIEHGGAASLVTLDGRYMVRYPKSDATPRARLPLRNGSAWPDVEGSTFRQSPIDGSDRLVTYRRLARHPIYVMVTLSKEEVLEDWWSETVSKAGIASIAILLLGWVALIALRHLKAEAAVWESLRTSESEVRDLNASLEERVRERTADLAATNAELESFSYSVSHDLRAPLRHMTGYASMLRHTKAAVTPDSGRLIEKIEERASYMNSLIDELLHLSRIARASLARERLDLSGMAHELVNELCASEPERSVAVDVEPGLHADGDAVLIRSLLENLIGNAWKYSSRKVDAHITIGSALVHGEHVFFVNDNGVGFDPAFASKLFGAFQRLHSQSEFKGTGIGLATARRVVTRHGGRIWADSSPGKGATFFFTLREVIAQAA